MYADYKYSVISYPDRMISQVLDPEPGAGSAPNGAKESCGNNFDI